MYYSICDTDTKVELGIVHVLNPDEFVWKNPEGSILDEVTESWTDYNQCRAHDNDPYNVDEFIEWHNENCLSQLERILLEPIHPNW